MVGYTTRRGGGNLPTAYAPWELIERVAMLPGASVIGSSGGSDEVLAGIQRDGFFLTGSDVIVAPITPPKFEG